MNNLGFYSVLQAAPSRDRQELINVGLVIYWREKWDVRVLPNLKKVWALNPSFPSSGLINMSRSVLSLLDDATNFREAQERLAVLGNEPGLQNFVGQFPAEDELEYETEIEWLLRDLVFPPVPEKRDRANRIGQSRLRTRLRNHFKHSNLLSKNHSDIVEHKVIEQYPIVEHQGLYAQFALKNSVMHITETIDFDVERSSERNKVIEAQAKTLILSAAREHFGANTKRHVVVAGIGRKHAQPSISLLRDYAEIYSVESAEDMNSYFTLIERAAAAHI